LVFWPPKPEGVTQKPIGRAIRRDCRKLPANTSLTNHSADSFLVSGVNLEAKGMNVIVFASRKGGSGKSTLAAHLAAHIHKPSRPVLLVDCDPQGSLTLWQRLRGEEPPLVDGTDGVGDIVRAARRQRYAWTFIDTPPN